MNNEKIDNQLKLALESTEEQRSRTADLNLGYDAFTNTWELIVRHAGSLEDIQNELDISVVELLGGYAIITIPQYLIGRLTEYPQIEYIEMPKGLFFAATNGKAASCINGVQESTSGLFGSGVIIAIIDSGIDYAHPDFRNDDGTTRILDLWDQTIEPEEGLAPPEGFATGTLYTRERINEALKARTRQERQNLVPSADLSGHGTHVAGIAAGNGRGAENAPVGVAPMSELLIVKLGASAGDSFPKTTQLMQGMDYVVRRAIELRRPLVINLSFGNNYGSHANNSILEQYINDVSGLWKTTIAIGTGNEGASSRHYAGVLTAREPLDVEMSVASGENTLNLQIWKNFYDDFEIILHAPGDTSSGTISRVSGRQQFVLEETQVFLYYGEPTPYNSLQEIYIEMIPASGNTYLTEGIWRFEFRPKTIITGNFYMWIPIAETISPTTKFLRPTLATTLTVPATSAKSISVGAYDSDTDSLAFFSGRGYTLNGQVKPDLVAPGVNIFSCAPNDGYIQKTGTSMATPFVAGAAALLMEWGIIRGFDPYLYGEKVKAYLIAGTRKLSFEQQYPNPQIGFGALCLMGTFRYIGIRQI
ncbi:S8 family peptidase [[Clostridium] polysaccharolyticum]|uniref:Subtilase family protein n=1 Tax=[Clostridium] polysaccharolyticum TaxID=29364 RepID=A0A1H9YWU6_9FIRM|nr:S8 family peptidase [[Clostridium] polysaccharolyticum]SES73164.1 Subtilase family protein [[Clostridium] polysaccharolyticum]